MSWFKTKEYFPLKMATVYVYSDFAAKTIRESHLSVCSFIQSNVKFPWATVAVVVLAAFFFCVGAFVSYHVFVKSANCQTYSCHDSLERTHRIGGNVTSYDHSEDKLQNLTLSQCLRTVEAINDTVSRIPVKQSRAYVHQLRYDVREKIDSFYGRNESLTPHHRRRPPVEAWNDEDDY